MTVAELPGVMQPTRAAVLAAVIHTHAAHGRVTVRDISRAVCCSLSTCHDHLLRLRRDGLVAWEPERQGTLRPLITPEAIA